MHVKSNNNQSGYALLEILLASVLGGLVIYASYSILFSMKSFLKLQQESLAYQEAGLYLQHYFQKIFQQSYKSVFVNDNADVLTLMQSTKTVQYFIADTHRIDQNQEPIFGLFVKNSLGHREELLSCIKTWQLKYVESVNHKAFIEMQFTLASLVGFKNHTLLWPLVYVVKKEDR